MNDHLCQSCFLPINHDGVGRMKHFCSNACRQAAYRFRKNGFERQRASHRTSPDFSPVPAKTHQKESLTLRNAGAFHQTNLVDLVGLA